ncbi:ABC transporter substrate-binding protein [Motiliproteus sp. SC1-56]|uniref:substrate-binding periplasmic protein n=1 Tax=Motiliproteus sp. SC1-56 TaxID=2799565 RepID=UPI001A8D27BF|nr:transporter substrate-binding domain-containing protein [Motiliproteus sp. SC1-56]
MARLKPARTLCALLLAGMLVSATASAQDPLVVRYSVGDSAEDARYHYYTAMLQLALDKTTPEFGPYRLQAVDAGITQQRGFALIREGRMLDVVWGMTSRERETETLAVPVPLQKGLLGVRVLLVKQAGADRFQGVDSLARLANYTGVQGTGWPDNEILRANGLNLVTSSRYESLFEMLRHGRADYFPRSITEIWDELKSPLGKDLTLLEHLVLRYRMPIYFFVSPDNETLFRRLQTGLGRARADGSFDALFKRHPGNAAALAFLRRSDRRWLELEPHDPAPSVARLDSADWYRPPPP